MTLHLTQHVSTGRNIVLRERFDSRTYETRFGLRVTVKTIMELERTEHTVERRKNTVQGNWSWRKRYSWPMRTRQ